MSAKKPSAAPPARPGARVAGTGPAGGSGGFISWLPLLGGLALAAGVIAYVINMLLGARNCPTCPRLDPKKQKWPEKTVKSWGSFIRFK